jgi:tetratricopeptide (TPR) repeat protein
LALLASVLVMSTAGCASNVSDWIVQTRTKQGDIALAHQNLPDASVAFQLALRIDPSNAHARTGLVTVQTRIAQQLFSTSRFEEAIEALGVANKYAPGNESVDALRSAIEQAEIKRDIVVSNYPNYKETGAALRRSLAQLKTESAHIGATLGRFDYTYDSSELGKAIRESYQLSADMARITDRLIAYRQLVDSGVPENAESTSIAPPASLLPLP